jgi:hypothetical protein
LHVQLRSVGVLTVLLCAWATQNVEKEDEDKALSDNNGEIISPPNLDARANQYSENAKVQCKESEIDDYTPGPVEAYIEINRRGHKHARREQQQMKPGPPAWKKLANNENQTEESECTQNRSESNY